MKNYQMPDPVEDEEGENSGGDPVPTNPVKP